MDSLDTYLIESYLLTIGQLYNEKDPFKRKF